MVEPKNLWGWNELHLIAQPDGQAEIYITSAAEYPDRQSAIQRALKAGNIAFSMVDFDAVPELPPHLKLQSKPHVIKITVPEGATLEAQEQALEELLHTISAASRHIAGTFTQGTVEDMGSSYTIDWAKKSLRSQKPAAPQASHAEAVEGQERGSIRGA